MAADEKILADFDKHHKDVEALSTWLDKLYYAEEFAPFFTRPVLRMMITGCDYLTENLEELKRKYIARKEGE